MAENGVTTSGKSIKWLIISTAKVNRHVVASLKLSALDTRATGRVNELYAVASRTLKSAQKYAAENDIPFSYGSYTAGLEDPLVDVVYISLPNELHAEWVLKALRHKKHVLVEKPMGLTGRQVSEMHAVARAEERLLVEGYMFGFTSFTKRVKEVVSDFTAGRKDEDNNATTVQNNKKKEEDDSSDSEIETDTPPPPFSTSSGAALSASLSPLAQRRLPMIGGGWKVMEITGSFTFEIKDRGGHRVGTSATGGGAIWDIGCYLISFCTILRGCRPFPDGENPQDLNLQYKPSAVHVKNQKVTDEGCVLEADFTLVYSDGLAATFHTSFLEPVKQELRLRLEKFQQLDSSGSRSSPHTSPLQTAEIFLPNPIKPDATPGATTPIILTTRTSSESKVIEEEVAERWNHLYRGQVEALAQAITMLTTERRSSYDDAITFLECSGAMSAEQCAANVHILEALHGQQ